MGLIACVIKEIWPRNILVPRLISIEIPIVSKNNIGSR